MNQKIKNFALSFSDEWESLSSEKVLSEIQDNLKLTRKTGLKKEFID